MKDPLSSSVQEATAAQEELGQAKEVDHVDLIMTAHLPVIWCIGFFCGVCLSCFLFLFNRVAMLASLFGIDSNGSQENEPTEDNSEMGADVSFDHWVDEEEFDD